MSPHVTVELRELRVDARLFGCGWGDFERRLANLTKRFRDVRNNEHMLKSRNKREGWRWQKNKRTHDKAWAFRYRKQTGAQVLTVRERK